MKDFTDIIADNIISQELPKIEKIMQYVAGKIQGDLIGVTYAVIDAYYQDYTPPERAYYIRTDEYKANNNHPKNKKNGQFRKKNKSEWSRSNDISLMSAMKTLGESGQPAIGICRPLDGRFGYQAGVVFDSNYFNNIMHHENKGFREWDIVENFIFGQHGNGKVIYFTEPHADIVLRDYLNSYRPRFDKHYNDACKKFK